MIELKNFPKWILALVFVGLLVGVGVLTMDLFSNATAESRVVSNESFIVPANGTNVSLANSNLTVFSYALNGSGATWAASNYTVDLTLGIITVLGNTSACQYNDTCYAYYTWTQSDTAAATALDAGRDAIGEVSTVWMSLIVTIIVLALLMAFMIRGFYVSRR